MPRLVRGLLAQLFQTLVFGEVRLAAGTVAFLPPHEIRIAPQIISPRVLGVETDGLRQVPDASLVVQLPGLFGALSDDLGFKWHGARPGRLGGVRPTPRAIGIDGFRVEAD